MKKWQDAETEPTAKSSYKLGGALSLQTPQRQNPNAGKVKLIHPGRRAGRRAGAEMHLMAECGLCTGRDALFSSKTSMAKRSPSHTVDRDTRERGMTGNMGWWGWGVLGS